MQIVRTPDGHHDRVQVSGDSYKVEFRSYELFDPKWVELLAVQRLYADGYQGDIMKVAGEIVKAILYPDAED